MSNAALLEALRAAAGAEAVRTDAESLALAASDLHAEGSAPAAVVRPSTAEVAAACIAAATSRGHAVVPRGGGLSYTGGYAPPSAKTVTVDLGGLNRIVDIAEDDLVVTVEAGVTWKQIHEALRPRGLRLPFFGTFSGAGATVGGGLSHGALFFGSARYGSAAEMVLELEVALADGTLLRTGQGALAAGSKPFLRSFGPDLTGLFVHDGGAFGIKTRASLRMIRAPEAQGYASFAFADLPRAADALSEIARADLAEEVYILDPAAAHSLADAPGRTAWAVLRETGRPVAAMRALAELARGGTRPIPAGCYSLHLVAAGRSDAAVRHDLAQAVRIATGAGGRRIASTVPRVARATLFSSLDAVLDADGGRWAALNAKVAHSDARDLIAAFDAMIRPRLPEMAEKGVTLTRLASALGNHSFSFEPVFHWRDAWLPAHRRALSPSRAETLAEPAANPEARVLVDGLRGETVALFRRLGAASNQIGRTYPYLDALSPAPAALLRGTKRMLDPACLMNPGVLGLTRETVS
ncbi:FAD-binding oxidoreductase [Sphingomonas sp.]|uniref:FAD-binding oxidoreductase n=1 Tax=Sphingomonas sp. TaxID=28214 RepID=UPI002DBD099E|nr:FAD-binding oxidoreductase [Sphingomonas sp.]HEU4970167.1 FAD-binding oxidoreductase [Sphingomonas sp.]